MYYFFLKTQTRQKCKFFITQSAKSVQNTLDSYIYALVQGWLSTLLTCDRQVSPHAQ